MLRGLAFSAVADAYDDENDDGNDVRSHLEKLLNAYAEVRDVVVNNEKSAEKDGAENADVRLPNSEDNQRDGEPASVAKAVVGPNAAGVVHNVVKAAKTGNHTADAGCKVFVFADVDAGGIRGGGIFAYGAEVKTDPGALEHVCGDDCDYNRGIGHKAVREEYLTEPAEIIRKGESGFEAVACCGKCDGRHIGTQQLDKGAAEEVADAGSEGGKRKTGYVLICTEGYGKESIDKTHKAGAEQGTKQRNKHRKERIYLAGGGQGLLIEEGADNTADSADIHNSGDTEVEVAGFFGDDFTGGTEQKRNALHNRTLNKRSKHYSFPPFLDSLRLML